MAYTVYMHTSPSGKRYIGITKRDVPERWRNGYGYFRQPHFYNAIKTYGWDNIAHEILLTGLAKGEAEERERFYIALFRTRNRKFGYNQESGGNLGKEVCDETRRKISEANSGERHWNYGGCASEETRAKLRAAVYEGRSGNLGKHLSEETKRKLREANLGKRASEETRRKMSEMRRGSGNSMYGRHREPNMECINKMAELNRKPVINLDTGEVFDSIKTAADSVGIDSSSLAKCCKNYQKLARGYHWAYVDDKVAQEEYRLDKEAGTLRISATRRVINLDTNMVYESVTAAARSCGLKSVGTVVVACKDQSKTAGGYHWAYVEKS